MYIDHRRKVTPASAFPLAKTRLAFIKSLRFWYRKHYHYCSLSRLNFNQRWGKLKLFQCLRYNYDCIRRASVRKLLGKMAVLIDCFQLLFSFRVSNEKLSKRARMLLQLTNNNIVHMTFILDDAEKKRLCRQTPAPKRSVEYSFFFMIELKNRQNYIWNRKRTVIPIENVQRLVSESNGYENAQSFTYHTLWCCVLIRWLFSLV